MPKSPVDWIWYPDEGFYSSQCAQYYGSSRRFDQKGSKTILAAALLCTRHPSGTARRHADCRAALSDQCLSQCEQRPMIAIAYTDRLHIASPVEVMRAARAAATAQESRIHLGPRDIGAAALT